MKKVSSSLILSLLAIMTFAVGPATSEETGGQVGKGGGRLMAGFKATVKTMQDGALIAASSAVGAPAYHRHLVRPGSLTTYALRLFNAEEKPVDIKLEIGGAPEGWTASLAETEVKLDAKAEKYVLLKLAPSAETPVGNTASVKVTAAASSGKSGEVTLDAETTAKRKIYYVSIDSLGPEYLDLNAKGTGPGKDGDWLMPNLHAFIDTGTFYPQHKAHLVSATDMNHASFLSGAYPGRLGLYSVQVYLFGFDSKGNVIAKTTPLDIMYYGSDGKPVTTIFNVVKDPAYGGNSNAFTAYISGKSWVPEHYRNPIFGLDRIASTEDLPDYVTPSKHEIKGSQMVKSILKTHTGRLTNPDIYLWEDIYTIDQTIQVVNNEDPDVAYILLAAVDMGGHTYGSGKDPAEWDTKNTPDNLADDISKINKHANREGIIKSVKNADEQLGRFIEFLKKRGTFEDSYIVLESDHNMETNSFDGIPAQDILKNSGLSPKKDYFLFTGSQLGAVFKRRDDSNIIPALEKTLESYRVKSPFTGKIECPMIVLNREEMKTGIDTATGRQITPPMELYSDYYIEHPKKGSPIYPDLMMFANQYYQFPLAGANFGNIGLGVIPFDVPPFSIFVGGHGSVSTQSSLLAIRGPNLPVGKKLDDQTYASDVAPTLMRLDGYKLPESVQGKGLPKVDPTLP